MKIGNFIGAIVAVALAYLSACFVVWEIPIDLSALESSDRYLILVLFSLATTAGWFLGGEGE